MIDEKKLIEQCILGNSLAQKQLYDLHSRKLYGICLRYAHDEEEAQDILQDGFVKIFTKLYTFEFKGSFEGWIKRIVTNTAIEYYRKHINIIELDESQIQSDQILPENKDLEIEDILKIIQVMPDGYRVVFNMYAIEGYSHLEIASKLGISEGTSKSQLSRARSYIQKKIEQKNKINLQKIQPLEAISRLLMYILIWFKI